MDNLKLLFVGSMSQRKEAFGSFEAMKLLKGEPISLSRIWDSPPCGWNFTESNLLNLLIFRLAQTQKFVRIMQLHDALVLPSIVEGRALVQQEALSCGLPIIVTLNAEVKIWWRKENWVPCSHSSPPKKSLKLLAQLWKI